MSDAQDPYLPASAASRTNAAASTSSQDPAQQFGFMEQFDLFDLFLDPDQQMHAQQDDHIVVDAQLRAGDVNESQLCGHDNWPVSSLAPASSGQPPLQTNRGHVDQNKLALPAISGAQHYQPPPESNANMSGYDFDANQNRRVQAGWNDLQNTSTYAAPQVPAMQGHSITTPYYSAGNTALSTPILYNQALDLNLNYPALDSGPTPYQTEQPVQMRPTRNSSSSFPSYYHHYTGPQQPQELVMLGDDYPPAGNWQQNYAPSQSYSLPPDDGSYIHPTGLQDASSYNQPTGLQNASNYNQPTRPQDVDSYNQQNRLRDESSYFSAAPTVPESDDDMTPHRKRSKRSGTKKHHVDHKRSCLDCGKNVPRSNESDRCTRCHQKWQKNNSPFVVVDLDLDMDLAKAHHEVYAMQVPITPSHDTQRALEHAEDLNYNSTPERSAYWIQRILTAINLKYNPTQEQLIAIERTPTQHLAYVKTQKAYVHKFFDQGKQYNTKTINARVWLLYETTRRIHAGGYLIYDEGGDNSGYSIDRELMFSERLLRICEMLMLDKRVCMDVIEGRGVNAFVRDPHSYEKRKQDNVSSNSKKAKLRAEATTRIGHELGDMTAEDEENYQAAFLADNMDVVPKSEYTEVGSLSSVIRDPPRERKRKRSTKPTSHKHPARSTEEAEVKPLNIEVAAGALDATASVLLQAIGYQQGAATAQQEQSMMGQPMQQDFGYPMFGDDMTGDLPPLEPPSDQQLYNMDSNDFHFPG